MANEETRYDRRRASLLRQLDRLEEEEAKYFAFKEELAFLDTAPENTVIRYELKLDRHWYSYAALFIAGYWYTTGVVGNNKITKNQLAENLVSGHIRNLVIAKKWRPITKEK